VDPPIQMANLTVWPGLISMSLTLTDCVVESLQAKWRGERWTVLSWTQ